MTSSFQRIGAQKWREFHLDRRLPGVLPDDFLASRLLEWISKIRGQEQRGHCFESLFDTAGDALVLVSTLLAPLGYESWVCRLIPLDAGVPLLVSNDEVLSVLEFAARNEVEITLAPFEGRGIFGISLGPTGDGQWELLLVARGTFKRLIQQAAELNPSGVVFDGN